MEFYAGYFAFLAFCNVAFAYHRYRRTELDEGKVVAEETLALPKDGAGKEKAKRFKLVYFGVYALVMAADWLQGPYMYALYKEEKALPESTVAALFTTGFVSAGITASFVGTLADKYGRKQACLAFCLAYSISCLSVLSNDTMMLFVGRALGGLSTTLLYSVFETWMIAEYHSKDMSECLRLQEMFSGSITLSGIVAIVAGIVGEAIVGWSGAKSSPFLLAIVCLLVAFAAIWRFWAENHGAQIEEGEKDTPEGRSGMCTVLYDKRILTLMATTTIFEGSMYLFVFFWSPALKSSRVASGNLAAPPFGMVFSCFMCAMMLGSMIFGSIDMRHEKDPARLMLDIVALAANSLLIPALATNETAVFWCFALFELSVGLYFPSMSRLKSDIVADAVRGKVYGMMRLPLNVLVVCTLSMTREGDVYRSVVFTCMGVLLLGTFLMVQKCLL